MTPVRSIGCAVLQLALVPIASYANEYTLEYGVEAQYEYNDNIALRTDEELGISGGRLVLPATITVRSERLDASLASKLSFSRYSESEWGSDDQDLRGKARYKFERGELEGHAGYIRDSTRNTEFLDTGSPGFSATRVETLTAGGSGLHMFTARSGIVGGVDYSEVGYESPRLVDHDNVTGYAGWLYHWNERIRLRLQGYGSRFENDAAIRVQSDGLGMQFVLDFTLSEKITLSLLSGWSSFDTTYTVSNLPTDTEDDESDGLMLDGSIKYIDERYELEARVISLPLPSGNGYLVTDRQLDLIWRYRLTEESRLDVGLLTGHREALDSRIDNQRDYSRARVALDYRFSPRWNVVGSYVYTLQSRDNTSGDANSNAVFLDFIYGPERVVWSR